jgi:hypothetical protein
MTNQEQIDLDFDDAEKIGAEADLFGIKPVELIEAKAAPNLFKRMNDSEIAVGGVDDDRIVIPRPNDNPELFLQLEKPCYQMMRVILKLTLDISAGASPAEDHAQDYFLRYSEAMEYHKKGRPVIVKAAFMMEGAELVKSLRTRINSLSPRAAVARAANQKQEKIDRLLCATAMARMLAIALKLIACYDNWPGAPAKWMPWYDRFDRYYCIAKGSEHL